MSDLKAWWGTLSGREAVLVARTGPEAAKLAGIGPADMPFRFERTARPRNADKPGVYRNAGAGVWVRDEQATGSIGPEIRELLQSAPMSALAALKVAATLDVNRAVRAVFAELAEGDRQLAEDTWNRWSRWGTTDGNRAANEERVLPAVGVDREGGGARP